MATPTADNVSVNREQTNVELMVHSTLRHEEYLRYDERLTQLARERLTLADDLRSAGLVVPLGFGTTMSAWERIGDVIEAEVNMDGRTEASKDRVTFDEDSVPIPVISRRWGLAARQIEASRTRGEPLPMSIMEASTRAVMDTIESMIAKGLPNFSFQGKQVYGYTNFPARNTLSLAGSWATSGSTIKADTIKMLQAAYNDNFFGPFTMYVAKDIWANIQDDYSSEKGDRTHMERITAFSDISRVRPADMLPAGNVVLVQLTSDVIDIAVSQDIVNIQWEVMPMSTEYMIYAAMATRLKSDKDGRCGIVHATG